MLLMRQLPAICPSRMKPPSSASPPAPVISMACWADLRLLSSSWLKPTSKNDSRLVNSQNRNSSSKLSALTQPTIAVANRLSSR